MGERAASRESAGATQARGPAAAPAAQPAAGLVRPHDCAPGSAAALAVAQHGVPAALPAPAVRPLQTGFGQRTPAPPRSAAARGAAATAARPARPPARPMPAPASLSGAAVIQRRVDVVDSSKKGKKGQPRTATPADVTDWLFLNISKAASLAYPANLPALVQYCNSAQVVVLDSAKANESYAKLREKVPPGAPATDKLDQLDAWQQFNLLDPLNHLGDLPAADAREQWTGFLDSFDRDWGHLKDAKKAGQEDYRALPKLVSLIRRRYESKQPVFVGIGASPDVIIEFFRQSRPNQPVATIPISDVKFKHYDQTDDEEDERLQTYIGKCLGKWWTEPANLVLLDTTDEGDTLEILQDLIRRHDADEEISREVITASLSATATYPDRPDPETVKDTEIEIVKTSDREITTLMRSRLFFQNIQGYKGLVGRIYKKLNTFANIASGDVDAPQGYDRAAHLKIIEFVHYVREAAKKDVRSDRRRDRLLDAI